MTARGKSRPIPGLNGPVLLFLCHSLFFHIGLLGVADILLNFYLASVGYDAETIGLLQSLPRLSGFLIGLPIGWMANRIGNRRLILLSTWGLALSVAATALTQALIPLAISRFCWGACFGANQVAKPPFMVTLADRREHTSLFAYHNLVSMFAVAMGSALGGILPTFVSRAAGGTVLAQSPLAYQGGIVIAALLILLSGMPVLFLGGDVAVNARQQRRRLSRSAVPWLEILRLCFPLFVFGISGGLTFPFFNLFFREVFGMADSAVGGLIGLGWLVMGVVPMCNPFWEARLGRAMALTVLMAASAVAFVGLSASESLLMAALFYVLAIGLRNTMQPLFQPLLMASLPADFHNIASSVGLALWNLGWFGATLSFGFLQGAVGYRGIMLLAAFFVLMNGLSIRATTRKTV